MAYDENGFDAVMRTRFVDKRKDKGDGWLKRDSATEQKQDAEKPAEKPAQEQQTAKKPAQQPTQKVAQQTPAQKQTQVAQKPRPQQRQAPRVSEEKPPDAEASVEPTFGGTTTVSVSDVEAVPSQESLTELREQAKAEANKRKRPQGKSHVGRKSRENKGSSIRNIAPELMNAMRDEFPRARNNGDLIAAYIAFHSGLPLASLDESVQELVADKQREDPLQEILGHLSKVTRDMVTLRHQNEELELVLAYILYDRMGWRRDNPTNPSRMNMVEGDIPELLSRMRQQSTQFRHQQAAKEGRPR